MSGGISINNNADGSNNYCRDVLALFLNENSWTRYESKLLQLRYGHAMCIVGERCYNFFGQGVYEYYMATLEYFDMTELD